MDSTKREELFCTLCERPKVRFIRLADESEICSDCFKIARLESLNQHNLTQRREKKKKAFEFPEKLFEPQNCCKCGDLISEARRFVQSKGICKRCERGIREGLSPEGSIFIDEHGRLIRATSNPKRVEFPYGTGELPRSKVSHVNDKESATVAFNSQRQRCWDEVIKWSPLAIRVAKSLDENRKHNSQLQRIQAEELASDIGHFVIGRCYLLYDGSFTFQAYLQRSLLIEYKRALRTRVHTGLSEDTEDSLTTEGSALDAADVLDYLGFTDFDRWLIEQRLMYSRSWADLAKECDISPRALKTAFNSLFTSRQIRVP